MNFLDNVVKSSNALLKDRLTNPFGARNQTSNTTEQQQQQPQPEPESPQPEARQELHNHHQATDQATLQQTAGSTDPAATPNGSQFAAIAADAEAVAQKAAKGAKDIGSFLFSMANKAGQTVSQTAKQVKQAVESTSILTDLTREQQEFIKQHGGNLQAAELPWSCYSREPAKEASVREQILGLSQDRRNFVRGPPSEANFQFDPQQCYPIALSLLKEDSNLSKMRFELVPKLVNEDTFWRNYFYRVSLLKQMIDRGEDITDRHGWASSRSSSGEGPDGPDDTGNDEVNQANSEERAAPPPQPTPTATTSIQDNNPQPPPQTTTTTTTSDQLVDSSEEESRKLVQEADELQSKLKELDLGFLNDTSQDDDKWEEELQKDLQEFELVDRDFEDGEEEPLDKEIAQLLSK